MIKIERPIAFIDIESTGVDKEKDRIIELAICGVTPDMHRDTRIWRFNPGMPIPPKSTEIHGITDADVANSPFFQERAKEIFAFIWDCDLGGFNSNAFDIPLLYNEFLRAGIHYDYTKVRMIDVGNIFKIRAPRTLEAAVRYYCGRDHDGAHGAASDVRATVDVFLEQMLWYPDLPDNMDELHLYCNYGRPILDLSGKFSQDEEGDIILNFGKYRGEKAKDHLDFVDWMYYKASFPPDTRAICERLLFTTENQYQL